VLKIRPLNLFSLAGEEIFKGGKYGNYIDCCVSKISRRKRRYKICSSVVMVD